MMDGWMDGWGEILAIFCDLIQLKKKKKKRSKTFDNNFLLVKFMPPICTMN